MKNALTILFITLFSFIGFVAVGNACDLDFFGGTDMVIVTSKQASTSFSIPEKFIINGSLIVPLYLVVEQNGEIIYQTYATHRNIVLPFLNIKGKASISIQLQDYTAKKLLI